MKELVRAVGKSPERTRPLIEALIHEGFLEQSGPRLRIASGMEPDVEPKKTGDV